LKDFYGRCQDYVPNPPFFKTAGAFPALASLEHVFENDFKPSAPGHNRIF